MSILGAIRSFFRNTSSKACDYPSNYWPKGEIGFFEILKTPEDLCTNSKEGAGATSWRTKTEDFVDRFLALSNESHEYTPGYVKLLMGHSCAVLPDGDISPTVDHRHPGIEIGLSEMGPYVRNGQSSEPVHVVRALENGASSLVPLSSGERTRLSTRDRIHFGEKMVIYCPVS